MWVDLGLGSQSTKEMYTVLVRCVVISLLQPGGSPWGSDVDLQAKMALKVNHSTVYICKLLPSLVLLIKLFACIKPIKEDVTAYTEGIYISIKFICNFGMLHRDKQVREIPCWEDHQHQLLMDRDLCKWYSLQCIEF